MKFNGATGTRHDVNPPQVQGSSFYRSAFDAGWTGRCGAERGTVAHNQYWQRKLILAYEDGWQHADAQLRRQGAESRQPPSRRRTL